MHSEHENDSTGQSAGIRLGWRDGLLVLRALWRVRRHEERRYRYPQVVSVTPQSEAVETRAKQLAAQHREDDQAVAELRTLAEGKRRVLKRALRGSRQGGLHRELAQVNGAYRLILAAQHGSVVPPVADDDRARIAEVEGLMALPRAERWARLVEREPRLTELEDEVRQRHYRGLGVQNPVRDEPTMTQYQDTYLRLDRDVASLIGPTSHQTDILLRARRAEQAALDYLLHVAKSES